MFNTLTDNQVETGTDYAKVFTLKKSWKGNTDWHNNQVLFTIFQANSYNGYIQRQYFLATIKGNGSKQTTIFKEISGIYKGTLKAVIVENDESIQVYVKGKLDYVPVRVKVDYCGNLGLIDFTTSSKFNNVLENITEAEITNGDMEITLESGWKINENRYSHFYIKDNVVNIKCNLTAGYLGDNTKLFKIVSKYKPSKPYITFNNFVDSVSGDIRTARIIVNEYGDVLVSKMNNIFTNDFNLEITYKI